MSEQQGTVAKTASGSTGHAGASQITEVSPRWMLIAGFASLAVTLLFLMGIVLTFILGSVSSSVGSVPALRYTLISVVSIGMALGAGFLGGRASIEGKLPFFNSKPVAVSLGGGIAVFVIVFLISNQAWEAAFPDQARHDAYNLIQSLESDTAAQGWAEAVYSPRKNTEVIRRLRNRVNELASLILSEDIGVDYRAHGNLMVGRGQALLGEIAMSHEQLAGKPTPELAQKSMHHTNLALNFQEKYRSEFPDLYRFNNPEAAKFEDSAHLQLAIAKSLYVLSTNGVKPSAGQLSSILESLSLVSEPAISRHSQFPNRSLCRVSALAVDTGITTDEALVGLRRNC